MSHIFISYNQEDADFADVLTTNLKDAGFDTWMDRNRLLAGSDWSEEIDQGILAAMAVVLVMSPNSRDSEYVTYEWSYALGAGVRVIPVLRKGTQIHPRLARLQHLDFSGKVRPWDILIQQLGSLKAEAGSRWTPPRGTPPYLLSAISGLDSANVDDRRAAIVVLAESDDEIATLALRHALAHPFRNVRALAAIVLADREETTPEILHTLIDALTYSSDYENDQTDGEIRDAFRSFDQVGYDYLVETAKSASPKQYAAVKLMSEIDPSAAIPVLIDLLDSEDRIAVSAIEQLGKLKVTKAVPLIMRLMTRPADADKNDSFSFVRLTAMEALIDIGDKSIEPHLVEATRHELPQVRMCAAQVLGKLCGASAIPVISPLLKDVEEAQYSYQIGSSAWIGRVTVGLVAAQALDDIHTPLALDLIQEFRREHPREDSGTKEDLDVGRLSIDAE
jgi:HEAT repeat protein